MKVKVYDSHDFSTAIPSKHIKILHRWAKHTVSVQFTEPIYFKYHTYHSIIALPTGQVHFHSASTGTGRYFVEVAVYTPSGEAHWLFLDTIRIDKYTDLLPVLEAVWNQLNKTES